MKYQFLALVILACFGCGKGTSSVAVLPTKKDGQFYRVVNLTAQNLDVTLDDFALLQPYIPAFQPCSFRKSTPKKHTLKVKDSSGKLLLEESLNFEPGAFVTYCIFADKVGLKLSSIPGESRARTAGDSEVRAVSLVDSVDLSIEDQSGKNRHLTVSGGLDPPKAAVKAGKYQVMLDGKPVNDWQSLEDGHTYTLIAYPSGKRASVILLQNSPDPMGQAAAAVQQSGG
ncbi:MAG: hypothetical protein H7Y17_12870 [Chlorobia bacterium]|nr:hypothetical protein [Fimbriimonadaceae bacterium]